MPENTSITFSTVFLDKIPPMDVRIDEMIQWGKKIFEYGFIQGVEVNLSIRTKMGFIITGSDISLDNMSKDGVVEVRGVVFGLNRPSVYAKGQVVPARAALLHSAIYEAMPDINAIICMPGHAILETVTKYELLSTHVEQPAGSQELVKEALNLMKLNHSVRCFVLNNYGIVGLGATMSDAGKQIEAIQDKAESCVKAKPNKKKTSK